MEKVECLTPTPGKQPTKIEKIKYDAVSAAILAVLPNNGDGLLFKGLPDLVSDFLGREKMKEIGSSSWYTTTVKLDLEAKGLIYRVPKSSPQRLLKK